MAKLTLGDRIATGFLGVVAGAVIGAFGSWLFGVYPGGAMQGDAPLDFVQVILHSAALFGLLGFLFGPVIGTIVGSIIGGYFRAALWNPFDYHPPTWVGVLMVVGIVAGGWWWLAR